MTREEWLNKIIDRARPMFAEKGAPLPDNVRATLAPPQRRMKAIGLCWHGISTSDKGREIWISSELDNPMEVAGTLIHELCHAALPDGTAHKAPFAKLARAFLLEGKATATTIGAPFMEVWEEFITEIGPIPGGKFLGAGAPGRKQETIPLKNLNCPECGFFAKVREAQMGMGRLVCPVDGEKLLMKCEEV